MLSWDEIKELIRKSEPPELIILPCGSKIKVRALNNVSDQARIDINKIYTQLLENGKL